MQVSDRAFDIGINMQGVKFGVSGMRMSGSILVTEEIGSLLQAGKNVVITTEDDFSINGGKVDGPSVAVNAKNILIEDVLNTERSESSSVSASAGLMYSWQTGTILPYGSIGASDQCKKMGKLYVENGITGDKVIINAQTLTDNKEHIVSEDAELNVATTVEQPRLTEFSSDVGRSFSAGVTVDKSSEMSPTFGASYANDNFGTFSGYWSENVAKGWDFLTEKVSEIFSDPDVTSAPFLPKDAQDVSGPRTRKIEIENEDATTTTKPANMGAGSEEAPASHPTNTKPANDNAKAKMSFAEFKEHFLSKPEWKLWINTGYIKPEDANGYFQAKYKHYENGLPLDSLDASATGLDIHNLGVDIDAWRAEHPKLSKALSAVGNGANAAVGKIADAVVIAGKALSEAGKSLGDHLNEEVSFNPESGDIDNARLSKVFEPVVRPLVEAVHEFTNDLTPEQLDVLDITEKTSDSLFVGIISKELLKGTIKVAAGSLLDASKKNLDDAINKIAHDYVTALGKSPINIQYAGKKYPIHKFSDDLKIKYPEGIWFDDKGFPDFDHYVKAQVKSYELTGIHHRDIKIANKLAGFEQTPDGFTWHHHQDSVTMQLVPRDLHKVVKHTGGSAILRKRNE